MLRCLDLENERLVDDHVECLPSQWLAPEIHHDGHLSIDAMPACAKLPFERKRSDIFSISKTQLTMNREEPANHGVCEMFMEQALRARWSHSSSFTDFVPFVSSGH